MFDLPTSNPALTTYQKALEEVFARPDVAKHLSATKDSIRGYMAARGIDFEGRDLPMSLRPLAMDAQDIIQTAVQLRLVRRAINRVIAATREDIRSQSDTSLTRFFNGYETWFDLIGAERRRHDDVMLMRFDTARDPSHGWQAMEPNAACPGGVIHCAYLRAAWCQSELGTEMNSGQPLERFAIDSPSGFLRFMESLASATTRRAPHVVICNYKGTYTNELDSLTHRAALDRAAGLGRVRVSTADIRELEQDDTGGITLRGEAVDVIYNKLDPLAIDPTDPDIAAWCVASRSDTCTFLNSFGAFYIGEAKSVFAALHSDEIADRCGLTNAERAAIGKCVLPTERVRDLTDSALAEAVADRARWVLKEDATTRGMGVVLGETQTAGAWRALLADYGPRNGVLQRAVDIPSRPCATGETREFFGADWFFFGDTFGGCVSRAHGNKIFNVGNGGCEVPVMVLSGNRSETAGQGRATISEGDSAC